MSSRFDGTPRYELLRPLGRGGMGAVWEALDHERGEPVALKTLAMGGPGPVQMFKQEFRALQGVRHENLVRLFELHEHEGTWFITMEVLPGTGLLQWVRDASRHDPERLRPLRAVEVLEHIASKEAAEVLTRVAKGAPGATLTRESREALRRMGR